MLVHFSFLQAQISAQLGPKTAIQQQAAAQAMAGPAAEAQLPGQRRPRPAAPQLERPSAGSFLPSRTWPAPGLLAFPSVQRSCPHAASSPRTHSYCLDQAVHAIQTTAISYIHAIVTYKRAGNLKQKGGGGEQQKQKTGFSNWRAKWANLEESKVGSLGSRRAVKERE